MKKWLLVLPSLLGVYLALQASGVVPAIVPAAVPIANKRGNSSAFQLASNTTASTAGATFCDDGSGNTTTSGCHAAALSYSGTTTPTGTQYFPASGGAVANTTEASVQTPSPGAGAISNFYVSISAAPGAGNSIVFTWRNGASSQTLTCTISGASATTCNDTTHSFTTAAGDLVDVQTVTTGTVGSTGINFSVQFGATAGGGGGGGGVNPGTFGQVANYASTGSTVSGGPSNLDILGVSLPGGTMGSEVHKNLTITSGSTATVLNSVSGAGYISEMFMSTNNFATMAMVTVDGEGTPSVQANLSDLFGDNYADSQPSSWNRWISVSNNGTNNIAGTLRIPIPFASSVTVQLKNNSAGTITVTTHIIYHTGISDAWVHTQRLKLNVVSASGIAANTETDMVNVTPNKPGRLVGLGWIYDGFPGGASPKTAPLEGAFKVYIDGASTANYATGGSDDFFGIPFYFRNAGSFGATGSNTLAPNSADVSMTVDNSNTWGAMRFFIQDPITFTSALRFTWTCGNTSAVSFTGTCTLKSSVYYYVEN